MKLKHALGMGISALALSVSIGVAANPPSPFISTADKSPFQMSTNGNIGLVNGEDFVSGEVLVRFKQQHFLQGLGQPVTGFGDLQLPSSTQAILDRYGAISARSSLKHFQQLQQTFRLPTPFKQRVAAERLSRWVNIKLEQRTPLKQLIEDLRADPSVEAVEPNYIYKVDMVPNDPYWSSTGSWGQSAPDLWGLQVINADNAWDVTQGAGTVVAVIDSGLDANHPDIAANVWSNPGEIAGNNIDDDGNGYIDDVNGWDFVDGDAVPEDGHGHGTHVAGTIAAVGNNSTGIIGVAPQAKIVPVKGLGDNGSGTSADLINALTYVADLGVDVVNNSWGGVYRSQSLTDAVDYAHAQGVVVVAAAGNDHQDAYYHSPSNIGAAITVGAVEYDSASSQTIASFSNYGPKVDVFAPGKDILSLLSQGSGLSSHPNVVGSDYVAIDGTSMATPHVAGAAALLLADDPTLTPDQVRNILKATASDRGPSGWDMVYGPGVLDVQAALNYSQTAARVLAGISSPSPFGGPGENTLANGVVSIEGDAKGANFQGYEVAYAPVSNESPGSFTPVTSGSTAVDGGVLATWDTTSLADGEYVIRLTVHDTNGASSTAYQKVTKDSTLVAGWPRLLKHTGYSSQSLHTEPAQSVIAQDVNNDGLTDMVVTLYGTLYVIDNDGTTLSSYTVGQQSSFFAERNSPVTLADLDGDGDMEIVYVSPRNVYPTSNEQSARLLLAKHHDGTLVAGFPAGPWPFAEVPAAGIVARGESVAPIVTDLEDDGVADIVFVGESWNNQYKRVYLFAVDETGEVKSGFPILINDGYYHAAYPPIVADFDGDGDKEIVALTPVYEPNSDPAVIDNLLLRVYGSDGLLEKSRAFANFIREDYTAISGYRCAPKAADVDRDGKLEIVLAKPSSINADSGNGAYLDLHVLGQDLSDLSGFPISRDDGKLDCNFQLTDLDADDELEIFMGSIDTLNAINHDGSQVSGYPTNVFSNDWPAYHNVLFYPDSDPNGLFLSSFLGWSSLGVKNNYIGAMTSNGNTFEFQKDIGVPSGASLFMTQANASGQAHWGMTNTTGVAYLFTQDVGSGEATRWNYVQGDAARTGVTFDPNPVTPTPGTCTEYTSTNSAHVSAGRATREGTWFYTYYTVGSHESLGNYGYTTTTVAETSPGYFEKGDCPAPQPEAPVLQSIVVDSANGSTTVSGRASDVDDDLSSVEIEFDNSGTWITVTGTANWSYTTTALSAGTHTVKARATDSGNRVSDVRGPKTFEAVSQNAPTVDSTRVSSIVEFDVTITGSASDADGNLDKVEVELNGDSNWVLATGTEDWSVDFTGLAPGDYDYVVRATDTDGLTGTLAGSTFTVHPATAPSCTVDNVTLDSEGIHYAPITATDVNNNLDTVEFRVDGGAWAPTTLAWGYFAVLEENPGDLAPGQHTVEGRVTDTGSLQSICGPLQFTVAQPAPPVVDSVEYELLNDDKDVRISGYSSDVNNDQIRAEVEFNDDGNWIDIGEGDYFNYTFTGLSAGNYDARVRVIDYKGNVSAESAPVSFTIAGATGAAPSVDSVSTSTDGLEVTVSGTTSDADGDLNLVEVAFDGGNWITATGTSSYSYTTTLSAGSHSVVVRATDAEGNQTEATPANFTLTAPSAPAIGSISVSVNGMEATVSGTASDADGDLDRVEVEFDDSNVWLTATGTGSWSYMTSSLSAGQHTVKARAVDQGGRYSTESGAVSFTLTASGNACFTDTIANHETAARVYIANTLYYATGSNTYLGSTYNNSGDVISLEETSTDYWEKVTSCP